MSDADRRRGGGPRTRTPGSFRGERAPSRTEQPAATGSSPCSLLIAAWSPGSRDPSSWPCSRKSLYIDPVSTDLGDWVSRQLEQSNLDDDAGLVVLTALESDEALAECLSTGTSSSVDAGGTTPAAPAATASAVFLAAVEVAGFRGIGPAARLELQPRPGLTIVAGRNGSGKSSFTEAFELVLTGGTYRWKQKSAQWKEHWRNLHCPNPASVIVELVEEGSGPLTLTTQWGMSATEADDRTTTAQRAGEKRMDGLGSLGWARPLERFRPILSYDELGGLLEGNPSELYDAIANVLGVGQLADGLKRIQDRRRELRAPETAATRRRKDLLSEAAQLDDERADRAAKLLRKISPEVDELRSLATGVTMTDRGPLPALRTLASIREPASPEEAATTTQRLRQAVEGLADAGVGVSARRVARLRLLERAIEVHAAHGDMTCPVCRSGRLDEAWAETSRRLADEERKELSDVDAANQTFELALDSARRLVQPRPSALDRAPVPGLERHVEAARNAWDAWAAAPAGSGARSANELADHLELHVDDLSVALADLRRAATEELTARDKAWEPLAARIAAWCTQWDEWLAVRPSVDLLTRAEKWLKDNDLRLKNERLEPIRVGAREAWAKLRQESNVEIGNLALEGSATRRRVRIDSTIDGADAGSLAVLSQGELHALALALFLPRATMAESPFRFVILDDPVQAMDPAKVDGLVDLLAELAQDRQVVVFSHDDRMASAVRRAEVAATILEVRRGKDSQVSVISSHDPVSRYLSDALALLRDEELPEEALRRTLPGLFRFAVESAAQERFFADRLKAGAALAEVELTWEEARSTRDRVGLAVYGDRRDLSGWASASPYRRLGLKTAGRAMHGGLRAEVDPQDALHDVRRLVADIRERRR